MDTSQPRIRVSSPADVLAIVPHLLGFHPTDSFVVIGVRGDGDRVELGFRYDLPAATPDAGAAEAIAGHAVEGRRAARNLGSGTLSLRHSD